ncbi:uracil-DNA-glycosylase, putative [Leishmania tarentolae]|uniref:Uracil-DNA glycosylase n=1 Tax=Leishmania tarentolae TaxID=5689 RepID=A0A640KJ31_LEITA|nr:uracil-DNA-glycosylase, putative [Leishmania tarentolae]
MQKTLFDFVRKGTSSSPAAASAVAAADRRRQQSRVSASNEEDTAPPTDSPPRKHIKTHRESSRSRSKSRDRERDHLKGACRDDAIDLDASVSAPLLVPTSSVSEQGGATDWAMQVSHTAARVGAAAPSSPSTVHLKPPQLQPTTSSRWLGSLITNLEWRDFLAPITADSWRGGAFLCIERFLDGEKEKGKVILPPATDIFNAFNSCPFRGLKVVLLGQDPYHDLHQAHGLCFSVLPEVPLPPSLRNIYKELTTDIPGFQAPRHGYLQSWSEQGMLMLNATLTVEAHKANSHSKTSGWTAFTDAVIQRLSQHHPHRLVFLLWGGYAKQKKKLINTGRHTVLESVHPSPLSASRGWFGCHCFSACNEALQSIGHAPMRWQLPLNASLN